MHWITGWPREDSEDLRDVRDHAQVVPPRGVALPIDGAASEIHACWVLKPLAGEEAPPTKIKDAREPFDTSCPETPQHLATELPMLTDIGRVRLDARQGKMYFFGADLRLVPHAGSAYLGIRREFAVTLHKSDGTFRIVLPQGRILTGSCGSFR
jgi:hypothetical protein